MEATPDGLAETSPESFRVLGTFNQLMIGVVSFHGQTPWERHPDDELLHVVAGHVRLVYPADAGREAASLSPGDVCVIPRSVWHRQVTEGATIMFMTSLVGTDHMPVAEDPSGS